MTPMSHVGPKRSYIDELNGLRCIAILSVLASHFRPPNSPAWTWLSLGWVGVDLFFVISGYLITNILLDLRTDSHPYRTFYARRILRIFPLYYLYLLIVMLAVRGNVYWFSMLRAAAFLSSVSLYPLAAVWGHLIHHAPFITQGLPIRDHMAAYADDGLTMIWSLSVEELFYLLWAPVVLRGSQKFITYCAIIPILLCPVLRLMGHTQEFGEYSQFLFRVDALLFGAAVALLFSAVKQGRLNGAQLDRWIGAALWMAPLLLLVLVWHAGVFRNIELRSAYSFAIFGYSLCGIFFAAFLAWCIRNAGSSGIVSRNLRHPAITYIGRISYGMYLIHIYAFLAVLKLARHMWGSAWQPGIGCALIALLLAIGLASISWRYMEVPILSLKERYFPSPAEVPAVAVLLPVPVLDFPMAYAQDAVRKAG